MGEAAITIGDGGKGDFNLADIPLTSGTVQIGVQPSAVGGLSLANEGALWTINGALTVGVGGRGLGSIRKGGQLHSKSGSLGAGLAAVAKWTSMVSRLTRIGQWNLLARFRAGLHASIDAYA